MNYYDFKECPVIAVDIETKDPELRSKGTGVYRKDGYVIGCSLSDGDRTEYYPIAHPDTSAELREINIRYLKEQLSHSNSKLFANGLYDLDWLENFEGIKVCGPYEDVQIAEPLLDEYRSTYSLDSLSQKYLGLRKASNDLKEYCESQGWKGEPLTHIWKFPQDRARFYAKEDTRLTMKVFESQMKEINREELNDIYRMEMDLYPLLLQMRRQGVRLDKQKLLKTGHSLADKGYGLHKELNDIAGFELNVSSAPHLKTLFDKHGIEYSYNPPTEKMLMVGKTKGNPCFSKDALKKMGGDLTQKILDLRHIETLLSLFIHPYNDLMVGDRLHCSFHPLRSDEYGTVSGRFSSSKPNLQQVSGKQEDYEEDNSYLEGQVIRKLFIPEEDCEWLKLDWSQIEYRLIAHYAIGDGADTIRARYNENRKTDYHEEMGKLVGLEDRKIVKTLNFGTAYGMGPATMGIKYQWDVDYALQVYKMYHDRAPFVKKTSGSVARVAKNRGYIRTLLGRRARLRNPQTSYVMFNRLIQGSAADIMKKAMVKAYKDGIFNTLFPHLTVHDEMDVSKPNTKEGYEASMELKNTMETCVELRVPLLAEYEFGSNWGELIKLKEE